MLFRVVNRLKSGARLTENNAVNRILNKYVTDKISHYRVLICKVYIPDQKPNKLYDLPWNVVNSQRV